MFQEERKYKTSLLTIDTPVAGEEGGHAGGAGAVRVAVEEGEVGRHKVRAVLHPHREFRGEMGLSARDEGQQVIPSRDHLIIDS